MNKFNKKVFIVLLISGIVNILLGGINYEGLNNYSKIIVISIFFLGSIVVFIMFLRDKNYKLLYCLGSCILNVIILIFFDEVFIRLIMQREDGYNFMPILNAISYSYLYEKFRLLSYNHVRSFYDRNEISYSKDEFDA